VKVAVVLPELDPHQGGGFTFQGTLYEEILAARSRTAHRFVFYAGGARDEGDLRPLGVGRRADGFRALHRLVRHLEDDVLALRRHLAPKNAFERSLERDGIELVWFATPWADDCGLPYIFTVWDLEYLRQPWFPEFTDRNEWELREAQLRRWLPKASAVIVPNAAGTEQLVRHFGTPRERILELTHPTPSWAVEAAADGDAPVPAAGERPYLLYPAQLWPHKDHATLLEALALLRERGRDFDLVLVGSDKGLAAHLRQAACRLDVRDLVQFRGFVPTEELLALYRGAHALTYTSLFGPENLPPLEAFALGCPVVAADVPGAREQLGDAAVLVPPRSPEAVADAVLSLEDDGRRAELVRAGRERAANASARSYVDGVLGWIDDFERTVRIWR
jgi:glycosyltransferase involved in cell wall biosynthesis